MTTNPSACPACGAPLSGAPSVCPFCSQAIPKLHSPAAPPPPVTPSVQIPGFESVQPVKLPVEPPKTVDQVPEWLADDAEELAAKYDSRAKAADTAAEVSASAAREISRQAAEAVHAGEKVATRRRRPVGWGCLGGCLTFGVLQVLCVVTAFVAEEVVFPGRWGTGESPFFVLALLVPMFVAFGVMGLIIFLIRRKG